MAPSLKIAIIGDPSSFSRACNVAGNSAVGFGTKASRGFKMLAVTGGAALIGLGAISLNAAGNFEKSLNTFQAVSGATSGQMRAIGTEAKALGNDLTLPGTSAKDAADAMTELAKGGLSVKDTMGAAKGVLQLSAAAQIDNAEAATITADALNSFHLAGTQATKVADLLAASANATTAGIDDMALALKASSAVAAQLHVPITDTTTALSELANAGIKGSDAGTSLKTMMLRLANASGPGAVAMKKLGLAVFDSHGAFKSMPQIVDEFGKKLHGMNDEQRSAALGTIFGSDAIRAANVILGGGLSKWERMSVAVNKHGAAAKLAAAQMKGYKGAMDGFKSSIETLEIDLGTPLLGAATRAAQKLSQVVGFVDKLVSAPNAAARIRIAENSLPQLKTIIPVLESIVNWIRSTWPQVQAVIVGALSAAVAWVRANWPQIRQIVTDVVQTIRSYITVELNLIRAFWAQFGSTIISITKSTFQEIRGVVQGALNVIKGIVNIVGGIMRGDWSRVWQGMRQVLTGALGAMKAIVTGQMHAITATIKAIVPAATAASRGLGDGITNAIKTEISKLPGQLLALMGLAALAIVSLNGQFFAAAAGIGRSIVSGVVAGLGGLFAAVYSKVKDSVLSAVHAAGGALHGSGEFMFTKHAIGKPLAEGVIEGWILGSADLPAKMTESLRNAIEAARTVIASARTQFSDDWGGMVNDALAAFDAIKSGIRTRSEKLIDKEEAARQAKALSQAITDGNDAVKQAKKQLQDYLNTSGGTPKQLQDVEDATTKVRLAQEALNAAVAKYGANSDQAARAGLALHTAESGLDKAQAAIGIDPDQLKTLQDAVASAQQQLDDALWEKRKARLERQAAEERKQLDARQALQRRHLEQQLTALEKKLERQGASAAQTQAAILKLLGKYGVDYKASGLALGTAFAVGLRESIAAVRAAADAIAKVIAKRLKLRSPAEEGPMADLDTWFRPLASTLLSGIDYSAFEGAGDRIGRALGGGLQGGWAAALANWNPNAGLGGLLTGGTSAITPPAGGGITKIYQVNAPGTYAEPITNAKLGSLFRQLETLYGA